MKRSVGVRAIAIALVAGFGCSDDDSIIVVQGDAGTEAGVPSSSGTTSAQASETTGVATSDTTTHDDDTLNASVGHDTTTGAVDESTTGAEASTTGAVEGTAPTSEASDTSGNATDVSSSASHQPTTSGEQPTSGPGDTSATSGPVADTSSGAVVDTSSGEQPTSGPGDTSATSGPVAETSSDVVVDTSSGAVVDTSTNPYADTSTGVYVDTGMFTYSDSDAGVSSGTSTDMGVDAGSPCVHAEDCTLPSNPCMGVACHDGACMEMPIGQGENARTQIEGDCNVRRCNGVGEFTTEKDDYDTPDDGVDCTVDSCLNGEPQYTDANPGDVCDDDGGAMCDDAGNCVECLAAGDCAGQDEECSWRTCVAGECGMASAAGSTELEAQTAHDCKKATCAGMVNDDDDTPDDSNPCTIDTCNNGVATFADETLGEGCGLNLVCNATGDCVGCNVPEDCPGDDDDCKTRTCVENTCGWALTEQYFVVASQTEDDCREQICDGNGNVTWRNDPSDPPVDASGCSTVTCNNGTADYSPKNTNDPCGDGDASFCDGAGNCVECNSPSQCGSDTACVTRTCDSHTCGTSNVDAGTATSTQSPGDCKENQCDGSGGVVTVNNNADVPDDSNQCTVDDCNAGTPSNDPANSNVACSQNGGSMCDGAGACVECNSGSECAGGICSNHQCVCSSNSHCASGSVCYEGECVTSVNGCELATATDMGAGPVTITFPNGNLTYSTKCVKVMVGAEITFNGSFAGHPLQGGEVINSTEVPGSSGPFVPVSNSGTTKTFTMTTEGTYPYYCIPHGVLGMNGAVFVVPGAG